jgi:flagellar biogenesis protein FliO
MNRASTRWRSAVAASCAVAWLLAPSLAAAQKLGQAADTDVAWWRVLGALALCLALAVGAAFAMRTRMRGVTRPAPKTGRQLQLVESLRLSHQVDVCLVACDGERLLVATSPQGVVLLAGARPGAVAAEAP